VRCAENLCLEPQAEQLRSKVADRDGRLSTANECFRELDEAYKAAEGEREELKALKVMP
jgi:hypothetical protein